MVDLTPQMRRVNPSQLRDRIERLRSVLADGGIDIPGGSRILAFAQSNEAFIRRDFNAGDLSDQRLHAFLSGARDVSELFEAASQLLPSRNRKLIELLRHAMGGGVLPTNENRIARSSQFELYIAALLKRAGANVDFDEPDLIIEWRGATFGVACKRIESSDQYRKRFRSGANQLGKSRLRGIVAVSFDFIRPEHYPGLIGRSLEGITARAPEILESVIEPLRAETWNIAQGRPVVALLASVVVPSVVPASNAVGCVSSAFMRIIEPNANQTERVALQTLTEAILAPPAVDVVPEKAGRSQLE